MFKNLSGYYFDFDYEDYGLIIYFLLLVMLGIGKVKYYYKLLNGDCVVIEGVIDDVKIIFINIELGDYVFFVVFILGSFDYNVLLVEIMFYMLYVFLCLLFVYIIYVVFIVSLFVVYLFFC